MRFFNLADFIKKFGAEETKTPQQPVQDGIQEVQETGAETQETQEITNESIYEYVIAHFKKEMNKKSFCNVVTFPMSFTIILNKTDYNGFKDYSRAVSKHIVLAFYNAIKEKLTDGKVCEALATYWNISFLQCEEEPVTVNQEVVKVNEGEYYICSTVHDKLMDNVKDNPTGSTIAVSKGGSQLFANVNINRETLENLHVVGETHVQIGWDPMLSRVTAGQVQQQLELQNFSTAVAKLSCQGKEFSITGDTCLVSGTYETRKDKNIFIVDSEFVENGHIHIQYMKKENKFKIAAFAPTELDGKVLQLNTATDKHWMDLSDGASINLANDVVLTFKKLI